MRLPLFVLSAAFIAGPCLGQSKSGPKKQLIAVGSRKSIPAEGHIEGSAGSQFALRVQSPDGAANSMIRSVSFFIGNSGTPTQPFRVHLYKANGNANQPGSDLLDQAVVAAAVKGGSWFTVDLTSYNLAVPPEGFFVGMEWIADGQQPQSADTTGTDFTKFQALRPTFEFKENRTWTYTLGKGWNLLTLVNNEGRSYNAMIKAEVEVSK